LQRDRANVDHLAELRLHIVAEPLEEPLVAFDFALIFVLDAEMHGNVEVVDSSHFRLRHVITAQHEVFNMLWSDTKTVSFVLRQPTNKFWKFHLFGKSVNNIISTEKSLLLIHIMTVDKQEVFIVMFVFIDPWVFPDTPILLSLKFVVETCVFSFH